MSYWHEYSGQILHNNLGSHRSALFNFPYTTALISESLRRIATQRGTANIPSYLAKISTLSEHDVPMSDHPRKEQ